MWLNYALAYITCIKPVLDDASPPWLWKMWHSIRIHRVWFSKIRAYFKWGIHPLLESLSTDVLEPRTSTGSRNFDLFFDEYWLPFRRKCQVVNPKMKILQLIGWALRCSKSKNINFRLTSVAQKRLCPPPSRIRVVSLVSHTLGQLGVLENLRVIIDHCIFEEHLMQH